MLQHEPKFANKNPENLINNSLLAPSPLFILDTANTDFRLLSYLDTHELIIYSNFPISSARIERVDGTDGERPSTGERCGCIWHAHPGAQHLHTRRDDGILRVLKRNVHGRIIDLFDFL